MTNEEITKEDKMDLEEENSEKSMETNEWKQTLWKKHCLGGDEHNPTDRMYYEMFMEAMDEVIPISELKRWVEENEKEEGAFVIYKDNNEANLQTGIKRGHNSALKALKDKFIKE